MPENFNKTRKRKFVERYQYMVDQKDGHLMRHYGREQVLQELSRRTRVPSEIIQVVLAAQAHMITEVLSQTNSRIVPVSAQFDPLEIATYFLPMHNMQTGETDLGVAMGIRFTSQMSNRVTEVLERAKERYNDLEGFDPYMPPNQ